MQFVPTAKPIIVVDDLLSPTYPTDNPQNDIFKQKWGGKMAVKKTPTG